MKKHGVYVPGVSWRRRLIVMFKEPVAGRVKTRLGANKGVVKATWFYRHTSRAIIARLVADKRFRMTIAVAPDTALCTPMLPKQIRRIGQGGGDLGRRMHRLMKFVGPGPAIIVGTDIPEMTAEHIAKAFDALEGKQAVLGAAEDGGYWLVGLARSPRIRCIFDNVRWSSAHALEDTSANLKSLRIGRAATLRDVDNGMDYAALKDRAGRYILPHSRKYDA